MEAGRHFLHSLWVVQYNLLYEYVVTMPLRSETVCKTLTVTSDLADLLYKVTACTKSLYTNFARSKRNLILLHNYKNILLDFDFSLLICYSREFLVDFLYSQKQTSRIFFSFTHGSKKIACWKNEAQDIHSCLVSIFHSPAI